MNSLKNAFRRQKLILGVKSLPKVSKNSSSIDVPTLDLNETTDSSEWDTNDEMPRPRLTVTPVPKNANEDISSLSPIDVEPDWSALPLVTFSDEAFASSPATRLELVSVVDLRRPSKRPPYKNLVLIVIAEMNEVLQVQLPRYVVALLSNYRYINSSLERFAQVEQIDLYLSNMQEYLQNIRDCHPEEFQEITTRIGRTIAVLASIIELVGRNASRDVFLLSFQKQMISAFNMQILSQFNVRTEYVQYLQQHRDFATPSIVEDGDEVEPQLADAAIQTDELKINAEPAIGHIGSNSESISYHPSPIPLDQNIINLVLKNHKIENHVQQQRKAMRQNSVSFFSEGASGDGLDPEERNDQQQLNLALAQIVRQECVNLSNCFYEFNYQVQSRLDFFQQKLWPIARAKDCIRREVVAQQNDLKRLLAEIITRDQQLTISDNRIKLFQEALHKTSEKLEIVRKDYNYLTEHAKRDIAEKEEKLKKVLAQNELLQIRLKNIQDSEEPEQRINRTCSLLQGEQEALQSVQKENCQLKQRIAVLEDLQKKNCDNCVESKKNLIVRQLQAGLNAAISDNNELQSDVQELKRQRKIHTSCIEKLKDQLVQYRVELTGKTSEMERSSSEIEKLTTELQRIRLELKGFVSENAKLKADNAQNDHKIASFEKLLLDSQHAFSEASRKSQAEYDVHWKEALEAKKNFEAILKEPDFLKGHLENCKDQTTANQALLSGLRDTVAEKECLKSQLHATESTIVNLGDEVSDLHQSNSMLKSCQKNSSEFGLTEHIPPTTAAESEKFQQLESILHERENIIRAMELGRESLMLRISGLQTDKGHCEKLLRELRDQLGMTCVKHEQEIEAITKSNETKLNEALSRLAQKGEQYEFTKANLDKLLKHQEELNLQIAQADVLKTQAEQRAERISDQSSREIDELELQIKSLQEQDKKTKTDEGISADVGLMTFSPEISVVLSQTNLSFQYGYDLLSGQQICENIYQRSKSTKEGQTEWPREPRNVQLQASPNLRSLHVQTSVGQVSSAVQTHDLETDTKFAQTDSGLCQSTQTQTWESNKTSDIISDTKSTLVTEIGPVPQIKVASHSPPRCKLKNNPSAYATEKALNEVQQSSSEVIPERQDFGRNNASVEDDMVPREDFIDIKSVSRATSVFSVCSEMTSAVDPLVGPPKPTRFFQRRRPTDSSNFDLMQLGSRNAVFHSDPTVLPNLCQYIYDILSMDPKTLSILVDMSDRLNYSHDDKEFHGEFIREFLRIFYEHEDIRQCLRKDLNESLDDFVSQLYDIIERRNQPPSETKLEWESLPKYDPVNTITSSGKLIDFFKWFLSRGTLTSNSGKLKIDYESAASPISLDQFMELGDYNNYLARSFIKIAPVSKNLKRVFFPVMNTIRGLAQYQQDLRFAKYALEFAQHSNKIKEIVDHEISAGVEKFLWKYERAINQRKIPKPANRSLRRLFGFKVSSLKRFEMKFD